MRQLASISAVLGTLLFLAACVTPAETEDDRLQRVGEQAVQGIDTTGLEALQ